MFGVKIAELKIIAKKIKGNQVLACELYETGVSDAMYLAGIVAVGSQMTKKLARPLGQTIYVGTCLFEYIVPGVATESPHAHELE